jgi:cytochrome c-type biogenesis protein
VIAAIALTPVGLAAAFAAGFVSFVSPCVWPLVPGYLSYVSGVRYDDLARSSRRVGLATAAFVLGFAAVFTLYGAGVGLAGETFARHAETLERVGGVVVILMGLTLLGVAGRAFARGPRLPVPRRPLSLAGAALVGMAFAIGWTPCVGPTLTAILAVAGTGAGATDGAALLFAYSLGLGVPFLAAGLSLSATMGALGVFHRHAPAVRMVSGAVLIAAGLLLATGSLTAITARLADLGPAIG